MKEKNTTIMISESTWKNLMSMKEVGETFDEVIIKLMQNKNASHDKDGMKKKNE